MPSTSRSIGLRSFQMGMVVTSFDLGGIVLLYPLMKFADRFGKLRFIALASFVCGVFFFLVPSFPFFIMLALLTFISGGVVNAIVSGGNGHRRRRTESSPIIRGPPRCCRRHSTAGQSSDRFVCRRRWTDSGMTYLFYVAGAMVLLFTALPLFYAWGDGGNTAGRPGYR